LVPEAAPAAELASLRSRNSRLTFRGFGLSSLLLLIFPPPLFITLTALGKP